MAEANDKMVRGENDVAVRYRKTGTGVPGS